MTELSKYQQKLLALQNYADERALLRHGLTKEDIKAMATIPITNLTRLGSGYFGFTYLVPYKGKIYVRKDKGTCEREHPSIRTDSEINLHRQLSLIPELAPYVPAYVGSYVDEIKPFSWEERGSKRPGHDCPQTLTIVMEYIQGVSIVDICEGLGPTNRRILEEIFLKTNALLAKYGFYYGDFKHDNYFLTVNDKQEVIPVFVDVGGMSILSPKERTSNIQTKLREKIFQNFRYVNEWRRCVVNSRKAEMPLSELIKKKGERLSNTLRPIPSSQEEVFQKNKDTFETISREDQQDEIASLPKLLFEKLIYETLPMSEDYTTASYFLKTVPKESFQPLVDIYYRKKHPNQNWFRHKNTVINDLNPLIASLMQSYRDIRVSTETPEEAVDKFKTNLPRLLSNLQKEEESKAYQQHWRGKAKSLLGRASGIVNYIPQRESLPLVGQFLPEKHFLLQKKQGGTRKQKSKQRRQKQTRKT